jgi:hypothetical protein
VTIKIIALLARTKTSEWQFGGSDEEEGGRSEKRNDSNQLINFV